MDVMRVFLISSATAVAIIAGLVGEPPNAMARIACKGPYQIVQGNLLATPFCEDGYLASVAREYGKRISGSAIRSNPSLKRETCQFIGHDNRVAGICGDYRPDSCARRRC